MNRRIWIVIPAYEPDDHLTELCEKLTKERPERILVVDDGSGEKYRAVFDRLGEICSCTVIRHDVNMGKGRALKDAFAYLLEKEDALLGCITADSDGQHTPEDIGRMADALNLSPDALILGCRRFDGDEIPFKSRFGNKLTRKVCHFLCGIDVSDTQTGLRGIPAGAMVQLLDTPGERFEFETNMLIECSKSRSIEEVPIQTIYDSKEHHRTHFKPVRDSLRIYAIFGKGFLKFLMSSLSSSVVDLVMFAAFCHLLKGWNAGLYAAAATVLARVVSATYNYLLNYKLVFQSTARHRTSAKRYVLLALIQMSVSALLISFGVSLLPMLPEVLIKAVIDTILFFVSYHIQQKYVF